MNEIVLDNASMPIVNGCDLLVASNPFYHVDRIIDFDVMIYVLEGIIYVTEDDIDYSVNPGQLLFLKKGLHHYGKFEIPKGTKWHFIHFYLNEPKDSDLFSADDSQIIPYTPVKYYTILPKKLNNLSGTPLERKIKDFTDYYLSNNSLKAWDINTRLWNLLSEISKYQAQDTESLCLSDQICNYLNEQCFEQFSATKIEDYFFLSYKHMSAIFKKEKGITMQQYHNSIKMNEAARLLRSTLLSVGEIGETVGFSDNLYFSRCFHSFHGVSPTVYRKQCRY